MTIELPHVISLAALVVSLLSLMTSIKERERLRASDFEKRLAEVTTHVDVLKMQMMVFWKDVAVQNAKILHSPHTPELDELIEKFEQDRLSSDELLEFTTQLQAIHDDLNESRFRRKASGELLLLIRVLYILGQRFLGVAVPMHLREPGIVTILQEQKRVDEESAAPPATQGEAEPHG